MAKRTVRIAVAINEFGQWAAFGRHDMKDDASMEEANGNINQEGPQACFFIEVDIPIPTCELFNGFVRQDEQIKVVNHKKPEEPSK